ncbi:GNAT family N-acetyltransferase, partial [Morganella morganii subsp. sibonii]
GDVRRNYIGLCNFLSPVADLYPNFYTWLYSKYMHNIEPSKRLILFAYDENDAIIGTSLLKINKEEKKICTFFISPKHQERGIGNILMNKAFSHFNDNDSVLITCSETRKTGLEPILRKSGFVYTHSVTDLYKKNTREFFYLRK